jgi:phosphatidylglycerol---prolipoprotein diacylglyceryl transferase
MDPILVTIGPLALRWYGVLIALGVVLGAAWTLRAARRRGLDAEWLLDMAPWMVGAGIVGARVVYVVTSPAAFFGPGGDPLRALFVWEGGISIHGAVAGILLVLAWRARLKGYDVWRYLDVLTPVAAFGIIGGRIGNFMNGTDTGGRLTDWPIGFAWPEPGTPTLGALGRIVFGEPLWLYAPPVCRTLPPGEPCVVHLTPLYGALVGLILVGIIAWALARSRLPGGPFLHLVVWYSVLRSVLEEPFRDNPLPWPAYLDAAGGVGLFTLTQLMSVPIVLVALYLLWIRGADATR